jgi:hypothetical protein
VHQLRNVNIWRQAIVGRQLYDLGLDKFLAALVSQRDPMVAVGDEICAAYLENRDRPEVAIGNAASSLRIRASESRRGG